MHGPDSPDFWPALVVSLMMQCDKHTTSYITGIIARNIINATPHQCMQHCLSCPHNLLQHAASHFSFVRECMPHRCC
eukprot:jgi/Mesvir1/7357/Mv25802-RA.1